MPTELFNFRSFFTAIRNYGWGQVLLELLLIGLFVWAVMNFLKGTRGARLLKGILFVMLSLYLTVRLLGSVLDLSRITFLYDKLLLFLSFAIIVVFQPELRRALMRLGETNFFRGMSSDVEDMIDHLVQAATFCSRRKIGALVAIEREVQLGSIAESGTKIDAELSADLLDTIFWPNSPLHDLGVVVSGGRVAFAGVQFPLAESGDLEKELGSRHRAAVGLSQESDAVVLVVSEETGDISIAERGVLIRKLTPDALRSMLTELIGRGGRGGGSPAEPKDGDKSPFSDKAAA
jgi:diadenylate cyclase